MFTINLAKNFVKELKLLKKKFNKIEDDLDSLFSLLMKEKVIGDRIQEFGNFELYKVRLKNSSSKVGKSGGFRIIYYLKRIGEDIEGEVLVLSIYSKSQKTDIVKKEILKILENENLI
jgi:mRNA-degrading endonuclease RelE of RelBE toxin-antitoxin system